MPFWLYLTWKRLRIFREEICISTHGCAAFLTLPAPSVTIPVKMSSVEVDSVALQTLQISAITLACLSGLFGEGSSFCYRVPCANSLL